MLRRNCTFKHVIELKIGEMWRGDKEEDVSGY